MEVKKIKLIEIANITMGQSPKSSSYNTNNVGMPFLQGNRTFGRLYPVIDTWTTEVKKIAKKNTILMSVRAPVGDLNIANNDICIGRGLCSIESVNNNNIYLYYLLLDSIKKIKLKSTGTVFESINRKELEGIEVNYFNEIEQLKISKILIYLDKKIELNNQINDNLYEIIEECFIKYICENRNKKVHKLSDYVTEIISGDWGKDSEIDNYDQKVLCIRGADIPEIDKGNKGKSPVRYILEKNLTKKMLNGNEIVIEISGGSPTQSTGRCCFITSLFKERVKNNLICTNFCRAIRLKNNDLLPIFYMTFKQLYKNKVMFIYENGTTGIKNLDLNSLLENEWINIVSDDEINKYNKLFYSLYNKIIENSIENEKLEQLRDTLLPKLMNGEIDLDKIEI